MVEEKKALSCPFCGGRSHHILGARQIRMPDVVKCLDCFAEIQGTYEPESALIKWNTRAQLPSQGGEAVAWRVTGRGGITVTGQYPEWAEADCLLTITPLYTAPPSPDAELVELLREAVRVLDGWKSTDDLDALQERIDAKLASLKP